MGKSAGYMGEVNSSFLGPFGEDKSETLQTPGAETCTPGELSAL